MAAAPIPGYNDDMLGDIRRFRELLFADQDLAQVMEGVQRDPATPPDAAATAGDPWSLFAYALDRSRRGHTRMARAALHRVLELRGLETRIRLWAWAALRRLGERPDADAARAVQGVVIEVELELGTDTLAAYVDGTARYINQSGAIIIWDVADEQICNLVDALLQSADALAGKARLRARRASLERGAVQVSLLTFGGTRVARGFLQQAEPREPELPAVIARGAELMAALIERAQSRRGNEN